MRYIPRNCIQPEAVLSKPILGPNGELLLGSGVKMTSSYIKKLEQLGVSGAYVDDPISEDLEIVNALSDELRSYAVKSISATFSKAADGEDVSKRSAREISKIAEMIVDELLAHGDVMLNMFDLKVYDSYTFFHCVNVASLSSIIGMGLNYDRDKLIDLAYASLLHDIGKVFIAPEIINKCGPLTDDEFAIIKKHPQDGYSYIKNKFLTQELTARGVLDHHERVDGSGYPHNKKNGEITEFGRLIAVADVYDALISDRSYRPGWFAVEAIEYIQGNCGKLFDYNIVSAFVKKVAPFPVGTCVYLSNGALGLVMENFEGYPQRPLLKVFQQDQRNIEPYFINLCQSAFDITIVATAAV